MKNTKKDIKFDSAILRFYSYLRNYRSSVIISLTVIPISILAAISIPYLTIKIIDENFVKGNFQDGFLLLISYMVLFVCGYIADTIYTFFLQSSGSKVLKDATVDLFNHVLELPQQYFDTTANGITLARLTTDFETIGETLAMGVINLFVEFIKMIALCSILLIISYQLSVIFVVLIPLIIFITQVIRIRLRNNYRQSRKVLSESISYLSECLQGMKTILLLRANKVTAIKYKALNQKFLSFKKNENIYESLLFSIMEGLGMITVAVVLLLGSKYTLSGALTIGTLIAFYLTLQKIFLPIREFTQQFTTIQQALASMSAVDNLFNKPAQHWPPAIKVDDKFKSLQFKDVSFRYNDNQPYVLKNINLTLYAKERIALVGRTGSGKTTITKLITKRYGGYEGQILLNGIDLQNYNQEQLLQFFNIMGQDIHLLNDSVAFNISLQENFDHSEIQKCIQEINVDKYINQFPDQLNYKIVENGKNLSLGQAQVVALARAYYRGKDIFILDEATASIDSVAESFIDNALQRVFSEKTVIAIAHRLSTIQKSDMIYVMSNGRIIERGNHQQLYAQSGHYHNLIKYNQQQDKTVSI